MNIGRRILYDSVTGAIILDTGEDTNATAERPTWNGTTYIDIPFGQDTDKYNRVVKYHVDIANKVVVFDQLGPVVITNDAKLTALYQNIYLFNKALSSNNKLATINQEVINALKTIVIGGSN